MRHERLLPLIVATALFIENMDSTAIATSLPAIAADLGTERFRVIEDGPGSYVLDT